MAERDHLVWRCNTLKCLPPSSAVDPWPVHSVTRSDGLALSNPSCMLRASLTFPTTVQHLPRSLPASPHRHAFDRGPLISNRSCPCQAHLWLISTVLVPIIPNPTTILPSLPSPSRKSTTMPYILHISTTVYPFRKSRPLCFICTSTAQPSRTTPQHARHTGISNTKSPNSGLIYNPPFILYHIHIHIAMAHLPPSISISTSISTQRHRAP